MSTLEMEATGQSRKTWKSPLRKLVRFFEGSRDGWKAKCAARAEECKLLGNQVRAVERVEQRGERPPNRPSRKCVACRRSWSSTKSPPSEAAAPSDSRGLVPSPHPRTELLAGFDRRAPHHSHSLGLIQLLLRLVLQCAVGFRGAAAVLKVASPLFPTDERAPSPNGGQMWLLRLGLYELSRPKEQADNWVWVVDHTIQIGRAKCLVVVGVRLSAWEAIRADEHRSPALDPNQAYFSGQFAFRT